MECKEMLESLAQEYKFQILAMEVIPDHIHLLVDCRPQFYISDMIKITRITNNTIVNVFTMNLLYSIFHNKYSNIVSVGVQEVYRKSR